MLVKTARHIVGECSAPSKMPGLAWSIPAQLCKTGSILRNKQGSVCASCYALKNRYTFPEVQHAAMRRLTRYLDARDQGRIEEWMDAMATLAKSKASKRVFRWFDSGDIQDVEMLSHIVGVAERAMLIRFWLPTRERETLIQYLRFGGHIPTNLVIRVSSAMINDTRPMPFPDDIQENPFFQRQVRYSCVVNEPGEWLSNPVSFCPAYRQGGQCLSCRRCWDRKTNMVAYPEH